MATMTLLRLHVCVCVALLAPSRLAAFASLVQQTPGPVTTCGADNSVLLQKATSLHRVAGRSFSHPSTAKFVAKIATYINVWNSTIRRAYMETNFASTRFNGTVEREEAVTSSDVASGRMDAELRQFLVTSDNLNPKGLSNSTLAAILSHLRVLRNLSHVLAPDEVGLILEDDVALPEDLGASLQSVLDSAPANWDVLKICAWGNVREEDRHDDNWFTVTGPCCKKKDTGFQYWYMGLCGYLVSGSSVQRVIRHYHSFPPANVDSTLMDVDPAHPIYVYQIVYSRMPLIHMGSKIAEPKPRW